MAVMEKIEGYISDTEWNARRKVRNAHACLDGINKALEVYRTTGVFYLRYDEWDAAVTTIQAGNPFDEFKEMARKDNRPFVMAVSGGRHIGGTTFAYMPEAVAFVLKRTNRVGLLVAPLLAIADSMNSMSGMSFCKKHVTLASETPGMWRFHFLHGPGHELFDEFLASFVTDETKRLVMRLPL